MALNWLLSFAHTIVPGQADGNRPRDVEKMKDELKKQAGDDEIEKFVKGGFQMPLHYPRYLKSDYEKMEGWQLDILLRQYGLNCGGNLDEKRKFAMGAFLWPDQF